MSTPDKPDIAGWFGLRRVTDWSGARWLGPLLSVIVVTLFVMAVMVVGAVLLHALVGLPLDAPRIGFGTGAVAVAVIGAPFVIWRAVVAQKTVSVQEQGQITDRINTAVEGLGAEKEVSAIGRPVALHDDDPALEASHFPEIDRNRTVIEWQDKPLHIPHGMFVRLEGDWQVFTETVPNLEVRIGAIYALERIAQDSDRDHVQIMEILCAYIRENARAADLEPSADLHKRPKPRSDIQTAITVIGRRSTQGKFIEARQEFRLDLRNSNLSGVDFSNYDFSAGQFHDCRIEAALFRETKLHGTEFFGSLLNYSDFRNADMKGTRLDRVTINRPIPIAGGMNETINMAHLYGVSLCGADISAVDYLGTEEEMNVTFGTGDTKLCEQMNFSRNQLDIREAKRALRRADRVGDTELANKIRTELTDSGYSNWVHYSCSDMLLNSDLNRFFCDLNLCGFPFHGNPK